MSFWRYLRDNFRLLLLCFAVVAIVTAMGWLDGRLRMAEGNVPYVAAVSFALFAVFVGADYAVRRRQALRLKALALQEDCAPVLPDPADYRDELYAALVSGLYARYLDSLHAAEENYRETAEYMAAWAHEVKTPLTAVRLTLEGMAAGGDRESLLEEVEAVEAAVERVLYLSRSDSFTRDYVISEVELDKLARECVKKHARLFIGRRVSLSFSVPEKLTVYSDRKWLLFILDQLVSNALKYSPEGGSIALSAGTEGRDVVLSVADRGAGIPMRDIERVFSKGFTGERGREPGSAATGLGLYLANKLARKLGHRVGIVSKPGEGTHAEVRFPAISDDDVTKL